MAHLASSAWKPVRVWETQGLKAIKERVEGIMKPSELALMGIGSIMVGVIIAISPFINILFGWWLSPLLILGGILAILASLLFGLWEALRISTRFLVCLVFREEEQGKPAFHHFHLNAKIWQLLGGGHCAAPAHS